MGDVELTVRQRQFADVALALLADDGMGAVTFRAVAQTAGMSLGAVQKAFASKGDMLQAMLARLREDTAEEVVGEPGRPTLLAWLTELTVAILPLDAERRGRQLQANAFADRAVHDPELAAAITADDRHLLGRIASLVRRAQGEGEVAGEIDAARVARLWLGQVTGLVQALLLEPRDEADVRDDVEFFLARLLAG